MNDPFFQGGRWWTNHSSMTAADGLTAVLHLPRAPESIGKGADEIVQRLPPSAARGAYLVDDFPHAPASWMRSEPGKASYMVPVKKGHGLWFDFRACARHTHDVAVVVSVQGVNALTLQPTDNLRLEQYRERCPIHGEQFVGGNRRCKTCGYDLPPQNYLATTGTPDEVFWLDGWRQPDGVVREFVFTDDVTESVAAAVLGDKRVHAFGFLFYLSREPKPPKPVVKRERYDLADLIGGNYLSKSAVGGYGSEYESRSRTPDRFEFGGAVKSMGGSPSYELPREAPLEIKAGAKIRQHVFPDPKPVDYWQDEPAGMIIVNYASEEAVLAVLESGRHDSSEGALAGLGVQVGHKA